MTNDNKNNKEKKDVKDKIQQIKDEVQQVKDVTKEQESKILKWASDLIAEEMKKNKHVG